MFFGIHVYKVYIKSFQPHNTCNYQQYMSTNYIDLINATKANNGHWKSNLKPTLHCTAVYNSSINLYITINIQCTCMQI